MQELIKITNDQRGRKAVSGREVHAFLGIETRYNDWFGRMVEYGFVENQDFEVLLKNEQNPQGGRPSTDHAISLDMAKEIAMIQKSEKGKQARLYFIECERRLTASPQKTITGDYLIQVGQEMNRLNQRLVIAETKIETDRPKVELADMRSASKSKTTIQGFVKVLYQNGIDINQTQWFSWLHDNEYLMREGHNPHVPTKRSIALGIMEIEQHAHKTNTHGIIINRYAKITSKGEDYFLGKRSVLIEKFGKNNLRGDELPPEAGGAITIPFYGDEIEIAAATATNPSQLNYGMTAQSARN